MSSKNLSKTIKKGSATALNPDLGLPQDNENFTETKTYEDKERVVSQKDKEELSAKKAREQRTNKRHRMDDLTEALGCKNFYQQIYWPWLNYVVGPNLKINLSVTRFYPEIYLALDIGPQVPEYVKAKEETFAKLFDEKKIKYVWCKDAADLKQFVDLYKAKKAAKVKQ